MTKIGNIVHRLTPWKGFKCLTSDQEDFVILHIKPANMLFSNSSGPLGRTLHLSDFGCSVKTGQAPPTFDSSYAAPELLRNRATASEASDVFSFGVSLIEMLVEHPFLERTKDGVTSFHRPYYEDWRSSKALPNNPSPARRTAYKHFDRVFAATRRYDASLAKVLDLMLHPDPANRPDARVLAAGKLQETHPSLPHVLYRESEQRALRAAWKALPTESPAFESSLAHLVELAGPCDGATGALMGAGILPRAGGPWGRVLAS